MPAQIQLSQSEHIADVKKFKDAHLIACRSNIGNNTFSAFFNRLVTLKKILSGEIPEPKYYQYRGFIDAHNRNLN
nr:hypothetical protein [Niastella yeongjuensis]